MKAVLVELEFGEAVFTIHYTKGFRETYPIPLPTSVAGMFGAMLGIERYKMPEFVKGKLFGAKLLSHMGIVRENFTYAKYKDIKKTPRGRVVNTEWGVGLQTLVNNPRYIIAVAGEDDEVKKILGSLLNGIVYLPYGGMNDHPALDIKVYPELYSVTYVNRVEGYYPESGIEDMIIREGGEVYRYPVKYKGSMDIFYFIVNGELILKEEIPSVHGIPLFSLEEYQFQVI